MAARCLITGVVLVEDDVAFNGDLFDQGDTYIVNCNEKSARPLNEMGRSRTNIITITGEYWVRRGVYVMPKASARLNEAARNYIGDL